MSHTISSFFSRLRIWTWSKHMAIAAITTVIIFVGIGVYFTFHSPPTRAATPPPPSDSCQLAQIAFCDTFQTAVGEPRANDLDPAKWSFSRISSNVQPFQFAVNNYPSATANACGTQVTVRPPADVFFCGTKYGQPNHLTEVINDGGIYNSGTRVGSGIGAIHPEYLEGQVVVNSNRAVQPFDFAGRTGNIVFDVTADLDGSGGDRSHGWWPEIWLTDQPVQAPHIGAAHVNIDARNAVGFIMNDCGTAGTNQHVGGGLSELVTINNFVSTSVNPPVNCAATSENVINHFQIKISQTSIQFWGSDAGGVNFRMLASANVSINFTRGYLSFEHVHYNAAKYGYGNTSTFDWHSIGFDGPVLPADHDYQAPDALHVITASEGQQSGIPPGSVNLGYQLGACSQFGCPCPAPSFGGGSCPPTAYSTPTFNLASVDVANATQAYLTYNIWYDNGAHQANAVVNGTNFPITDPNNSCIDISCFSGLWRTIVQPIPTSALHSGTNSVAIQAVGPAGQNPTVANIDLEVAHNP